MSSDLFLQALRTRQFPAPWLGHRHSKKFHTTRHKQRGLASINPNDGSLLVQAELFQDPDSLLDSAAKGLSSMRDLVGDSRFQLLKQISQWLAAHEEELIQAVATETGRPAWDVKLEFESATSHINKVVRLGSDFEGFLLRMGKVSLESSDFIINPLGVTLAYLPLSNPIYSFVSFITAALVAKCPLILYSSSHTIVTSSIFAMLDEAVDLPFGILSIIHGDFDEFRKLLIDNRVAAVIYNGSREHCETLIKEKKYAKRQLLLQSGGKNSALIHSSGSIPLAVRTVLFGAFKSSGQQSSATSRVFVYRSLLGEFKDALIAGVREMEIGRTDLPLASGRAHEAMMGPLNSSKAMEKFLRFQTMAARESSDTWQWGKKLEFDHRGFFVSPGIHFLENFDDSTSYQGNILFCPDLAVYQYDVLDEAIQRINQTDSPFVVSYIGDPEILESRRQAFLAPNLLINLPTAELEYQHPLVGGFTRHVHRFQDLALSLYLSRPQSLLRAGSQIRFDELAEHVFKPHPAK